MQKEMIISASGHETMVAILEEDLVTEVFGRRVVFREAGQRT